MYETKAQADKRRREYESGNARNFMRDKLTRYKRDKGDAWREEAKARARSRYASNGAHGPNALFGRRLDRRWHENALHAFRWHWADECEGVRIDHTGWHDNEEGDGELYRGAVLLTTRGTFLAAAVHGSNSRKRGWQSACGNEFAAIVESGHYDSLRDAAHGADGLAEAIAEEEREYNTAWRAGADAVDLKTEIKESRAEILANLAELRQARKALARDSAAFPHLCETLRREARAAIREITAKRKRIAELFEQFGDAPAFREHFN